MRVTGNRKQGTGNRETGNGKHGTGNREQKIGKSGEFAQGGTSVTSCRDALLCVSRKTGNGEQKTAISHLHTFTKLGYLEQSE